MNGPLVALLLQQPEDPVEVPANPISDGDLAIFAGFVILIGVVFGFDMLRTWWQTNQWRRDARRRRRELR